jgi:hypothetical protein
MKFDENAVTALKRIRFKSRYNKITSTNPFHNDQVKKIDKGDILKVLNDIGYKFQYAEQSYIYRDVLDQENEFQITINCKYNRFTCYFIVKRRGVYINLNSGNLGFILKYINDEESESTISLPWFRTIEEFKAIAFEILRLYEDFKRELISLDSSKDS